MIRLPLKTNFGINWQKINQVLFDLNAQGTTVLRTTYSNLRYVMKFT